MVSSIFCVVKLMIVYADILIFLNTLVNYFILLAVRLITRSHTKRLRIATGALMGGASAMLIYFENLGFIITVLKLLSAFLIVGLTFGFSNFKKFLKCSFFFFAINILSGGLAFALYIFSGKDMLVYSNGIFYFDVDMTFLVVCTVISYGIISVIAKLTDKKAPKTKECYVTIENNGHTLSCKAFMDTGNNLREPFSGYPVVMVNKGVFDKLYCDNPVRYIPVTTINGDSLIKAIRPDKLIIDGVATNRVYVGESSTINDEYDVILNINLEGEMQYD